MSGEELQTVALVVPLATAAALWRLRRPDAAARTGILLGMAWVFAALPPLGTLALHRGWWRFTAAAEPPLGMPLLVLFAWALLWGALPALALPRAPAWIAAALALWLDLLLMPRLRPLLLLGGGWLEGEVLLLALAFVPARLLAQWTARGERLHARATLQMLAFASLLLWTLPRAVEAAAASQAPGLPLRFAPPVGTGVALQLIALPALLGVAAVHEFATRGQGTPLPYDPPRRLVRSGPYAYLRNPMQLSAALVLLSFGGLCGEPWVMASGVMAVVYSAGIAAWDEGDDLSRRFGAPWESYRRAVRAWLPRWRPWHPVYAGGAVDVLYVSAECGRCSELGRWIEGLRPVGLQVAAAESHPARDLTRITYAPADGSAEEEGVAALARALEHVNLALALTGMAMRLPLIRGALQVIVDASGGGPMQVSRRHETVSVCPR